MTAEELINAWMYTCCETIKRYDHKAHMDLISEQVQVFGIPGYELIGYKDWFAQCEHEFEEKLITSAHYRGTQLKLHNESNITFNTIETILGKDGSKKEHGIEITLTKEQDGQWRVIQERLFTKQEAIAEGLPL